MMNPLKGEVPLELNGETYKCRLTIDSLVQIEEELGLGIIEIVTELSNAKVRIKWLLVILYHALRGGGNDFDDKKIKQILTEAGVAPATIAIARMVSSTLTDQNSDEGVKKIPTNDR